MAQISRIITSVAIIIDCSKSGGAFEIKTWILSSDRYMHEEFIK